MRHDSSFYAKVGSCEGTIPSLTRVQSKTHMEEVDSLFHLNMNYHRYCQIEQN